MTHFIEHIIEPEVLLLAWQSPNESHRTRYLVAKLQRNEDNKDNVNLSYLVDTNDFCEAQEHGFEFYPAFQDLDKTYENVIDAFMRRLPPRSRADFKDYLENFRIQPSAELSDFALLGYTGAKLPTDGFNIIHPFTNTQNTCEALIEIAGFRFSIHPEVKIGNPVSFIIEPNHHKTKEPAVAIKMQEMHIGYIPRGLIDTFCEWLQHNRVINAWVEKMNGTTEKPRAYIFVEIASLK